REEDRPHHRRQRDRGGERRLERDGGERRLLAPVEVGGDDGQGNFELAEIVRHLIRQELLAEFFRVDQRGAAEAQVEEIGKRARARRDQAAEDFRAVVSERNDEAADFPARHPRRVGGADQRADRGAGDGGGLLGHVVERLEHRDRGAPTRVAAAARKGGTLRQRRAASRAECKVDSLRQRAAASRATSRVLPASGRASGAMAAAFSLVAVPSRTRPTMPWKIAARRKKLETNLTGRCGRGSCPAHGTYASTYAARLGTPRPPRPGHTDAPSPAP